jgi:hypothetical protein
MEHHILKSLYKNIIMHDIKYFFSIKIIKQSKGDKKNFKENKLMKASPKNTIFQNQWGAAAPPLDHTKSAPAPLMVYHMNLRGVNESSHVGFGSGYIILLFFCSDSNPTCLNSGQKILTHTRSNRVMGRPDLCKIIKYLLIIFICIFKF